MDATDPPEPGTAEPQARPEPREIGLSFGALSDPLAQQLADQGVRVPPLDKMEHFQRDADALVRVSIRGLIPDAQVRAARKKLMKRITAAIAATTKEAHHA